MLLGNGVSPEFRQVQACTTKQTVSIFLHSTLPPTLSRLRRDEAAIPALWAKGYLQKDGTRSFQLSLSMALCDFSSQRTVEKLDVSKSFVSSCPSPTLFLPVPLDNHHHQLAQWLSPAFFGLDLCIHRDVPHRFHIVIRPTNSIETWSQMPRDSCKWFLGSTWWKLHFATKSCWL